MGLQGKLGGCRCHFINERIAKRDKGVLRSVVGVVVHKKMVTGFARTANESTQHFGTYFSPCIQFTVCFFREPNRILS